MATKAQIDANRKNAKKSTGPKTAEGKAAVARNALKHGLCSMNAVIYGEEKEEYEIHRQAYLDELKPVGVMESMLAERIVSLVWRLRRAELMQNQAIDYKIVMVCDDSNFGVTQNVLPKALRQTLARTRELGCKLDLGRALTRDLSNQRVMERLLMYERRIESSMFRTIKEFERLQKIRKGKEALATKEQSAQQSPPARRNKVNLKKQSQFAAELMGTMSCGTRGYGDTPPAATEVNKANQSRSSRLNEEQGATQAFVKTPGNVR